MLRIIESNVTIMVKDMDKSIQFYEYIGLQVQQRWENHYAMLSAPGITIGIHPTEGAVQSSGTVSVGFMIDNVDEAKRTLAANNISFNEDDGKSGHYLHFTDPDNTAVYFVLPRW